MDTGPYAICVHRDLLILCSLNADHSGTQEEKFYSSAILAYGSWATVELTLA